MPRKLAFMPLLFIPECQSDLILNSYRGVDLMEMILNYLFGSTEVLGDLAIL